MATYRYDPYLWVHLAGIATVPLWLAISGLGLAVGTPHWPGLELAFLVLVGVLPILWMQLWRPFYVFGLLALRLKPTALSDDQRRLLRRLRQGWVRALAVGVPLPLVWLLWEIYPRAVVASDITPFTPWGRLGGLAVAGLSFAMANLFLQVPVSILAVMTTPSQRFAQTDPYPVADVAAHFLQVGLPLGRLLPAVQPPDVARTQVQESPLSDLALESVLADRVPEQAVSDLEPEPAVLDLEPEHAVSNSEWEQAVSDLEPEPAVLDLGLEQALLGLAPEATLDNTDRVIEVDSAAPVEVVSEALAEPEPVGASTTESAEFAPLPPSVPVTEPWDHPPDHWDHAVD